MLRLFALAPLLAALAPPAAVAGPMSWTYQSVVVPTTLPNPTALPSQYLLRPNPDDGTFVGTAWLPTGATGAADGSGTVTLASASRGSFSAGLQPRDPVAADGFEMLMAITDGVSGQVGRVQFAGRGSLLTAGPGGMNPEVELYVPFGERALINIGRHRYDIIARAGGGEETARIIADVSVSDLGTANTPEPATLLMAGLGLAGVGLRRVRRG